jgi:hypothetical protein
MITCQRFSDKWLIINNKPLHYPRRCMAQVGNRRSVTAGQKLQAGNRRSMTYGYENLTFQVMNTKKLA